MADAVDTVVGAMSHVLISRDVDPRNPEAAIAAWRAENIGAGAMLAFGVEAIARASIAFGVAAISDEAPALDTGEVPSSLIDRVRLRLGLTPVLAAIAEELEK